MAMTNLIRSIETPCTSPDSDAGPGDAERLREWIVTNGLGGYASGTVCGVPTRRYHGLLIAALPSPLGRTMMLNRLAERVGTPSGRSHALGLETVPDHPGRIPDTRHLVDFRLEEGLPVWLYELPG